MCTESCVDVDIIQKYSKEKKKEKRNTNMKVDVRNVYIYTSTRLSSYPRNTLHYTHKILCIHVIRSVPEQNVFRLDIPCRTSIM